MSTKEELQEAADMLYSAERDLITEFETILTTFKTDLDSLMEQIPSNPTPLTPASQALARMRTMANSQFDYELNNLKSQYNLGTPSSSVIPTA